jgi:hypothetical protein
MTIDIKNLTMTEASRLYDQGNNAGRGWDPTEEDVDEAVASLRADGYGLVFARRNTDEVTVLRNGDEVIAVGGDAMGKGAWAVTISNEVSR